MSIRRKITVLLGLLAAVMLFQSVDRVMYLSHSAQSFGAQRERVELSLAAMDTLSDVVRQVDEESRVILASTDVQAINEHAVHLELVLADAADAAHSLGIGQAIERGIHTQLGDLSLSSDRLITARIDLISARRRAEAVRLRLRDTESELRSSLLQFELGTFQALAGNELRGVEAAQRLTLLNRLKSLLARLDDFLQGPQMTDMSEVQADVQRLLSFGVLTMSQTADFPQRDSLAQVFGNMKRLLSAQGGMSERAIDFRRAENEVFAAREAFIAILDQTGTVISGYVRASEEEIGRVYASATIAAKEKLWREILVNAGLGLGIVIAVWLVFARQISGRLEALAAQVLRLASGDLAPVAKPEGSDELSRMMSALAVFRDNACELRRSNEELANFAYVASHDLRTPLRAIRDLVDWTVEDHEPDLVPPVRSNLELIRARADRLSLLLQDLLNYARASPDGAEKTRVDVAAMVKEIGEFVDADNRLFLEFNGIDHIEAEETPLRTILMNLVGNAVKHAIASKVSVVVTTSRQDEYWQISVADDGPGIEPKYQSQVFELFKTLQSRDEVESSGMGLALVQKLAGQLGGTITLVSNPLVEPGTTFILRIPISRIPFGNGEHTNRVAA